MLQKLIPIILILLPTAAYLLWMAATARRGRPSSPPGASAGAGGTDVAAAPRGLWADAPWPWLISGGLLLAIVSFAWLALNDGAPAGSVYFPARVVDGVVQPGYFVTPDQATAAEGAESE